MTALHVTIPGEPVPKARPRLGRGGFAFTPKPTKDWEAKAKLHATSAASRARWQTTETLVGPRGGRKIVPLRYSVAIEVYRSSLGAGDLDNFIKAALDALNGIAFEDDRYVLDIQAKMRLSKQPRVEVTVTTYEVA